MTTAHTFDREEVMAYLDGQQADEGRAAAVRAHLETCDACRELATAIKGVAARLGEWKIEAAPTRLRLLVPPYPEAPVSAVPQMTPLKALMAWLRWPSWGVALVGVGIVAIVGVFSLQRLADAPGIGEGQAGVPTSVLGQAGASPHSALTPTPPPAAMPAPPPPPSNPVAAKGGQALAQAALPSAPMVVRIATMDVATDRFDDMRAAVERLTAEHQGHVASLSITGEEKTRELVATLRVPSARLDSLVGSLRELGRVRNESIGTEDVTSQFMDLSIRVANARREERRLLALLSDRTGKLSEVLEVERAIARVRTEIERMEASLKSTKDQVDLSTINLRIHENYRAEVALGSLSLGSRFRNAVVDGSRTAAASVVAALISAIQILPTLAVWALVLALPVRSVVRRVRRAKA